MVAGLITSYFAEAARLLEMLGQASELSGASALAHAAHVLGVRSEFVGARKLARMCAELERARLAGETQGLEQRIVSIRHEYASVHRAMEALRAGAGMDVPA